MKIITISIANWVDQLGRMERAGSPEGGEKRGAVDKSPLIVRGLARQGTGSGRTNRSRSEIRSRPIQFACDGLGNGGARQGAVEREVREKIVNRGGCAFCDASRQATRNSGLKIIAVTDYCRIG